MAKRNWIRSSSATGQFLSGLVEGFAAPIDLVSGRSAGPLKRPRHSAASPEGAWQEVGDFLSISVRDVGKRIERSRK
jgi:hypothetical protein